MKEVLDFLMRLPGIPIEYLLALVALAAIGLAVFTLHVIHAVIVERKTK